ncbi:MAG: tetratricopeptide repeat protein [Bacteroidales bacterium]|nr:tetratricopeptide repeat protein [Bacteroidales bacterium]
MKGMKYILTSVLAILCAAQMFAQVDRHDVRAGNRKFKKEDWREADISYRKALVKDSTSVAANYNLANTAYRQKNYDEAGKLLDRIKDSAPASSHVSDYWFNAGDVALAKKDYQAAVNAFKSALLANPSDLEAKENYIYAKKKLEDQQKNGGGQNDQNQNQDQNQNNQDNKDQQNDQQNDQNQQNKQDNKDQDKGQNQNNSQNQNNNQGQNQNGQSGQQPVKISPQQAQQMLKAIQAKEKETQDKVNREKAEALKSRQKEKNW